MKKTFPEELSVNVFDLIGNEWMLITAGEPGKFNTMTASWGGLGHLWDRNVSFCFVRPQRYTFEFMERSTRYSLCFFGHGHRAALNYCGTHSGRDVDKVKAAKLTPLFTAKGTPYFAEARLVLECRKLYAQFLDESSFVDTSIPGAVYPGKDFHRLYVGEIEQCLSFPADARRS